MSLSIGLVTKCINHLWFEAKKWQHACNGTGPLQNNSVTDDMGQNAEKLLWVEFQQTGLSHKTFRLRLRLRLLRDRILKNCRGLSKLLTGNFDSEFGSFMRTQHQSAFIPCFSFSFTLKKKKKKSTPMKECGSLIGGLAGWSSTYPWPKT